jgi:hypothetical protein
MSKQVGCAQFPNGDSGGLLASAWCMNLMRTLDARLASQRCNADALTARTTEFRPARWFALGAFFAGCVAGCGGAEIGEPAGRRPSPTPETAESPVFHRTIDPRRSLAVTEAPILARFSLQRVLDQLAGQSGVAGLTSVSLFQQWWDIMNPKPGLGRGAHCDDQVDATLGPVLNGFPYTCRPAPSEGAQATCDPFTAGSPCAYIPIGLFNRFDLMPENGAYCGEYRIVYGKQSGIANTDDRNLVIFEAAVPNPLPLLGLEGCRSIVEFWASLSDIDDVETRAAKLEAFYFQGLLIAVPPVPAVIRIEHFGDNSAGRGQIRTNQLSNPTPRIWSLREFKLKRTCGLLSCSSLKAVPVIAKDNPYGPLFAASGHTKAAAFQSHLPGQVQALSGATIPDIDQDIPDTYNSGQSQATSLTTETNYLANLGAETSPLRDALATSLANVGSGLTPDNIVNRVQAMSCAGCHRFSNGVDLGGGITWPASLGFTHVSERDTEVADGVTRYLLSEALLGTFLPHRKDVFERYLSKSLLLRLLPLRPIGGFCVH